MRMHARWLLLLVVLVMPWQLSAQPLMGLGGATAVMAKGGAVPPIGDPMQLRFEVQILEASYGLVPALHITGKTGEAVLLDVAALASRLGFDPNRIRTWCATLTYTAIAPEQPVEWPCHATLERAMVQLGLKLEVDLANAALIVRTAETVPIIRRQRMRRAAVATLASRDGMSEAADTGTRERLAPVRSAPNRTPSAAVDLRPSTQFDYLLSAQRQEGGFVNEQTGDVSAAWSQFGTAHVSRGILGGALEVDLSGGSGTGIASRWQWTRRDATPTGRRLIQLGALPTSGPNMGEVWGVGFGNPVGELFHTRDVVVTHRARPDWEYFALVGDGVLSSARGADGRVSFRVPLTGDVSPYELIAIGKDGREVRQPRLVQGMAESMGPGAVRHSTTLGRCRNPGRALLMLSTSSSTDCMWRGTTDWLFGVSHSAQLRTGVDIVDGRWMPFAGVRSAPAPSWRMEAMVFRPAPSAALNMEAGGSVGSVGSMMRQTTAVHTDAIGSSASLTWNPSPTQLASASWQRALPMQTRTLQLVQALPGLARPIQLGAWWNESVQPTLVLKTGRLSASIQRGTSRFEGFWQQLSASSTIGATGPGDRTIGVTGHVVPAWMQSTRNPWWVRASVARTLATSAWQHDVRLNMVAARADIELAQTSGPAGMRWSVLVAPRLSQLRLTSSANGGLPGGAGRSGQSSPLGSVQAWTATGSVGFDDRAGRVRMSADRQADRATLEAVVFLDRNANGVHDHDESMIPDVMVLAGNSRAATDARGRAILNGLTSREPVAIAVDPITLEQPCWLPAAARQRAQLTAAHVAVVPIPLREGVLVEGRVVKSNADSSVRALPSVLTLTDAMGTRTSVDLFADGWFSTPPLLPGRWSVSLQDGDNTLRGVIIVTENRDNTDRTARDAGCRTQHETLIVH
ncbi:MAG: hypothetical protein IBJ03_03030 [Gemmatimonadaceae bacterium]|nr:hypothetical protein [Gemmatimonadaceae bacterium]